MSRWFYANPIWYYHRRSFLHEIRPSGRFYQLVDPQLREVCRLLNDAGAHTMPSCQGHSYPRERFERIWEQLGREESLILGEGLVVKDCENEEAHLFRQSDYRVPWHCFEDFYLAAGAQQNVGYLGILVPDDRADLVRALGAGSYRTSVTRLSPREPIDTPTGTLFEVRVDAADPTARAAEWRAITKHIFQVLAEAHATCA